mgnify:CR=1 FL=1
MSDSDLDQEDDIPDLITLDDTEEGEIGDEDAYYGAYSGQPILQYPDDDLYGGGTTTEYPFQGGFGRGQRMQLESDPSYLGVGEHTQFFFTVLLIRFKFFNRVVMNIIIMISLKL